VSTAVVAPASSAPRQKRTLRYRFRRIWRVVFFAALVPFFDPQIVTSFIDVPEAMVTFLAGVLTLIPLATFIEVVTEDLIERLGQLVGGLIHAFFGNAAFFAITVSTLIAAAGASAERKEELVTVVQSSIAGTIIINILFILGASILAGGLRNGRMQFSAEYSNQYAEMLTVGIVALALPSLANEFNIGLGIAENGQGSGQTFVLNHGEISNLSNITAVILILAYVGYLGWTVFKFRDKPAKPENPEEASEALRGELFGPLAASIAPIEEQQQREQLSREAFMNSPTLRKGELPTASTYTPAPATPVQPPAAHHSAGEMATERVHQKIVDDRGAQRTRVEEEEVERERGIAFWEVALLIAGVAGVVFISDTMAEKLRDFFNSGGAHSFGLSPFFIGFIILPISSNIVELSAGISAAWHDRMETCLAVTAGSTIQVALLVAPALILVSHIVGLTQMNLVYGVFILAVFGLIAYLFQIVTVDGETTWLEGLQFTSFFAVIAAVAFFAGGS
jgi:Ca2+:H+ antiporter